MKAIKITFAAVFATFVVSCSSDDDRAQIQPDMSKHENLLIKKTEGPRISTFEYDANNTLRHISVTAGEVEEIYYQAVEEDFDYNSNGQLTQVYRTSGGGETRERYNYGTDGKLLSKQLFEVLNIGLENLNHTSTYTYSNNQVIVVDDYIYDVVRYVYTYNADGNLIEIKVYTEVSSTNPYGVYQYNVLYGDFDNSKTAEFSLPDTYIFPRSNINNTSYALLGSAYSDRTFTYEYNSDGYPTKKTDSKGHITTYEYKRL